MKSYIIPTCILATMACTALQAENLIINGDFETGEGNAFYQTPGWYNAGTGSNQGTNARSDEGAVVSGSYSATVIDRYNTSEGKPGPLMYVQKTNYIIEQGDSFALSYEWKPADQYWQRSTDTVRFVLFATGNDNVGGPVVWSSELTSDFTKGGWETVKLVSDTTDVVNSEAVGRTLFVKFYGIDTVDSENGNPHWARVDNIEVTAVKN